MPLLKSQIGSHVVSENLWAFFTWTTRTSFVWKHPLWPQGFIRGNISACGSRAVRFSDARRWDSSFRNLSSRLRSLFTTRQDTVNLNIAQVYVSKRHYKHKNIKRTNINKPGAKPFNKNSHLCPDSLLTGEHCSASFCGNMMLRTYTRIMVSSIYSFNYFFLSNISKLHQGPILRKHVQQNPRLKANWIELSDRQKSRFLKRVQQTQDILPLFGFSYPKTVQAVTRSWLPKICKDIK